jgi:hypothetical protein
MSQRSHDNNATTTSEETTEAIIQETSRQSTKGERKEIKQRRIEGQEQPIEGTTDGQETKALIAILELLFVTITSLRSSALCELGKRR